MHVGRRIALIRKRGCLSQEYVARGIISRGHYCNIELGRSNPADDILLPLAKKLDVPFEYLAKTTNNSNDLDTDLELLQYQLDYKLLDKAKENIEKIETDNPYVLSIKQELHFFLLKAKYVLLTNKMIEENSLLEDLLNIYITDEESVPVKLKFIYYYVMALSYQCKNIYGISKDYYHKALDQTQNAFYKAQIYYNIGLINHRLCKTEQAITYTEKAQEFYIKEHLWYQVTKAYILLGVLYWESKRYDLAEDALLKGLDLAKTYEYLDLEGKIYHNLGLVYDACQDQEKSVEQFLKCIEFKKKKNSGTLILSYTTLLEILLDTKKVEEAEEIIRSAKSLKQTEREQYSLMEVEARLHRLNNSNSLYESLITKVIDYYLKHNIWSFLIPLAREYSEYLASKYKYKDALNYAQLALRASENIIEGG